ncbi:MAG: glycosyltransferase family 4 protein, partial [Anaerolineales bacterium]|nr:glycosyltransferase family 4 protein [Anaerolineales bacterium]
VSPEGAYASRLQELGFRWVCFPLKRRGLNPLDEVWTLVRLFKLYRRENPDLVHQFTVKCVLYGSLVCHLLGIRRVVNSVTGLGYVFTEGDGARSWLRGLIKVFYRLILRRTWVIFQNPTDEALFLKNRLVERGRVALIQGSGVDPRLFSPQPEPDGPPLAILPARLLWDKGVGEFVEAARRLKTEGLRARFALVGDSDPDNPAGVPAAQVKLWEKEGMVEWWGWRSDMAAVYAQAHIVCLPSYREGMSKTLIEAAACGRPIITCNVPGCREVVQPGISGLLVPPRNAPALAEAMKRLIHNPDERKSMGAFGRKIAEDQFSMELVLSQTLAFYECIRSSQREAEL